MPNQTSMVPTKPLPANPQHLFCVFLSLSLSKHVPQLGGFAPKSSPSQQRAGQSHSSSSSSLGFPPKLTPNPGPAVSSTVQTGTAAPAGSELEKGVPFTYLGAAAAAFAAHRGSSSSPSPAAIPGLCSEWDCSHSVPKANNITWFLSFCSVQNTPQRTQL